MGLQPASWLGKTYPTPDAEPIREIADAHLEPRRPALGSTFDMSAQPLRCLGMYSRKFECPMARCPMVRWHTARCPLARWSTVPWLDALWLPRPKLEARCPMARALLAH
eukprot:1200689-Pyramimonas_sp.AAC.1